MSELTDTDREMLAFEQQWFKYQGAKETEVRERFGLGLTRYYARLNWILEQPEAMAADAMTVRRLLRLRDVRAEART